MASAAAAGITPSSASTVLAADSTFSQQRYLFSSVQIRPIAGRVYRSIKWRTPHQGCVPRPAPTLDCTRRKRLTARNPQSRVQLIEKQPATRLVRLKPFPVDHQLRNRPLAHAAHHLGRGDRIGVHVDLRVRSEEHTSE